MNRNPSPGIRFLCLAGVVVLLLVTPLSSQTPTGGLTGTVRDQSGAVIPGVTVTLTKTDTALTRSTITSNDGKYLFALLPPGEYEARVVQPGFSEQVKRVVVNVGLTGTLDFLLSVGQARNKSSRSRLKHRSSTRLTMPSRPRSPPM